MCSNMAVDWVMRIMLTEDALLLCYGHKQDGQLLQMSYRTCQHTTITSTRMIKQATSKQNSKQACIPAESNHSPSAVAVSRAVQVQGQAGHGEASHGHVDGHVAELRGDVQHGHAHAHVPAAQLEVGHGQAQVQCSQLHGELGVGDVQGHGEVLQAQGGVGQVEGNVLHADAAVVQVDVHAGAGGDVACEAGGEVTHDGAQEAQVLAGNSQGQGLEAEEGLEGQGTDGGNGGVHGGHGEDGQGG